MKFQAQLQLKFGSFHFHYLQCKRQGKNKRDKFGKEQAKLLLLTDDMIIFIEFYGILKKILELISEFTIIKGYKVSIQKSLVFPNISNDQSENEHLRESV